MDKFTINLETTESLIVIDKEIALGRLEINPSNALIVTDKTLSGNAALASYIKSSGCPSVVLPSGEAYKNLESIKKIAEAALRSGLDRQAVFIGIGGGVICDMCAFAASVYMRGCRLVLLPTSLLSMVDASIGGKTGVDFLEKKNLIGSFYPADKVFIYIDFLKTLPESEYRSGLAEIIKHALLTGPELLGFLEDNKELIMRRKAGILEELISKSLRVKAEYIETDFREQGIRAHLNFGHTFGHALEAAAGLGRFTHGEAVAWGMERSLRAGVKIGLTDRNYAERVRALLLGYGYNLDFEDFDRKLFFEAIAADKKKKNGQIQFILQRNIGETFSKALDLELVKEVI
ncbi:MAG: 3-dehydroquinate synthase [Spirochaetales bacterium]|nr:3-dehydroquinate synthase [Spirochaetales bacterium]